MNKAGIIDAVAKSLDCSKSQADIYVNTILETVKEGVRDTGKVQLMGFGTFEARQTKAREGRNPRTGEPMMIAASTRCAFKVGKQFKEMLCAKTPEPEAVVEEAPTLEAPTLETPAPAAPAMETPTLEPAQTEVAETAEVAEAEEVVEPTTSQWA
tara:strand:- start:204 stop:668 length:465 start_codon:yes stop_codon:yes gene_type:complete